MIKLQLLRKAHKRICRRSVSSPILSYVPSWQRMITANLMVFSVLLPLLTSCGSGNTSNSNSDTTPSTSPAANTSNASGKTVQVIAVENFWGSIASQLGGDRVKVTSIISNPDTDPHDYEPKPTDARSVASANYVIVNGAGYDSWATKLLAANPESGRKELNVGDLVGKKEGDNPHLWYNPSYVIQVIDQITADLKTIDPADSAYFDAQRTQYLNVGLKSYKDMINTIKQKYGGTPIGATESIYAYQIPALGLNLTTPPEFMKAIAEGQEPTAGDKAAVDKQVTQKQIKVLVYNKQNSTPDINALQKKAEAKNIPVVPITETLNPANATFQDWQVAQLKDLQQALAKSTGK